MKKKLGVLFVGIESKGGGDRAITLRGMVVYRYTREKNLQHRDEEKKQRRKIDRVGG